MTTTTLNAQSGSQEFLWDFREKCGAVKYQQSACTLVDIFFAICLLLVIYTVFVTMDKEEENFKKTYSEWKITKVDQLKVFLRQRGWKCTGSKEELVARCFVAAQQKVEKLTSALERKKEKEKQYKDLLVVDGITLTDPFDLTAGWEKDAQDRWPPTMMIDITEYLLTPEKEFGETFAGRLQRR